MSSRAGDHTGVAIPRTFRKPQGIATSRFALLAMTYFFFTAQLNYILSSRYICKKDPVYSTGSYLFASYRAAFAFSTTAAKAAGSLIAISDRLLRFSSMPAFFRPFMKVE